MSRLCLALRPFLKWEKVLFTHNDDLGLSLPETALLSTLGAVQMCSAEFLKNLLMFQRFRIAEREQEFHRIFQSSQAGRGVVFLKRDFLASWNFRIQKFLVAQGQVLLSKGQVFSI